MDPKATGAFISLLRKEHNMTQKQLAEKLNVSDKAVSRWETGRGYPDIESLEALSCEFSVSINELLYGKRIETPAMVQESEKDIAAAFVKTSVNNQHIRIIALFAALILIVGAVFFAMFIVNLCKEIMGSPNCVIAEDYSYMMLFGERYVPLVLEDQECAQSVQLVDEAQVEGAPFLGKLLFGDAVYSVKQCADNEIVYLQTEYDLIASRYFCLESKVEKYKEILQEVAYDRWSAEIITKDYNMFDQQLNDDLTKMLLNSNYTLNPKVNCNTDRSDGDEWIIVHTYQTDGPFRRAEGELIRKQGQYYWFDYDDVPATQNNADYSKICAYEIDDSYDEQLDELFSYLYK